MPVTAATSVSHLPIEWAGVVVSDGDAQAFGLAINDAGKALDLGLAAAAPMLGAPSHGSTVNAVKLGFQTPARMIAPSQADAATLRASGMPTIDLSQEAPDRAQGSEQLQKSISALRQPPSASAAPLMGEALKGRSQGLGQFTPGLLPDAGLEASSGDEQQADKDFLGPALHIMPTQIQAAQSTALTKSQATKSPLPRQDSKRPEYDAATTMHAGAATMSSGSEPIEFLGDLAGSKSLSLPLGSNSATPSNTELGRSAPAEADSGLSREEGSKAQVPPGDPAHLHTSPSNVQSASRVAADKPAVASDVKAAASDMPIADGATAPRQDNVAMLGQHQPIDAKGFAASISDNHASALQLGVNRQNMPAVNAGVPDVPAEAESGLSREEDSKVQVPPGDPAHFLASPSNVQSTSHVAADNPPVVSDDNVAASDMAAITDGAPAPRQDIVSAPGQHQPIDAAGFAASISDNQASAVQPSVNRQDIDIAKTDQTAAPSPAAPTVQPPVVTLQTSRGLGKGLALEMRKSIEDGREHMRVRLDPKDLGQLDVRLSFEKDGALRAVITASTSASNDLLRQEMPTLVRSLSDAGVRMDEGSLRFELQSGSGNGSGQRQSFQDERRPSPPNRAQEDPRTEEDAVFGTRPWRARGQFDLRA